jgi:hypothetical protein
MDDPERERLLKVDNLMKISPIRSKEAKTFDHRSAAGTEGDAASSMASEGGQMSKLTGIELKRAQLVPSAMFASPDAVVRSKALSLPQKIAILRRWEFDVRQSTEDSRTLAVSDEMRLLEEVRSALADLGVPGSLPEIQPVPAAAH